MAELVFRLNLDAEDVELVLDGKVVDTVGKDVLSSWVDAINAKRKPVEVDKPVEEKPVDVDNPVEDKPVEVDKPVEE